MKRSKTMRGAYGTVLVVAFLTVASTVSAADKCPTELSEAKAMLGKATAAAKKSATASRQDVQAPRQLAGAKAQDIQAPRGQDVQAPRAQDIQAPRGQDVQAPKAKAGDAPQDIQVPRGQGAQNRITQARKLIGDSEAACKKGDMALSASKAREAMGLLK
jgi:hypothetical protein